MPKTLSEGPQIHPDRQDRREKRRRRPRIPIGASPPAAHVPATVSTSKPQQDEAKKKIDNSAPKIRQRIKHKLKRKRGRPPGAVNKPPPAEPESDSEDDVPVAFTDVMKIVEQKTQETRNETRIVDDSFKNYKLANEDKTILLVKFFAAVPKLHEKVAAGAAFDDDLLGSVFTELFPTAADRSDKASSSASGASGDLYSLAPEVVVEETNQGKRGRKRRTVQSNGESESERDKKKRRKSSRPH